MADQRPRKGLCSFCEARATTVVSDDNDFFDCCAKCGAAWRLDPGFCGNDRPHQQGPRP